MGSAGSERGEHWGQASPLLHLVWGLEGLASCSKAAVADMGIPENGLNGREEVTGHRGQWVPHPGFCHWSAAISVVEGGDQDHRTQGLLRSGGSVQGWHYGVDGKVTQMAQSPILREEIHSSM